MRLFEKNISAFSDSELLEAYRAEKKPEFLASLYTRYTHMVYGVCMKYLKNSEDAADAVMNIYEKLSQDIHRHQIIKFSTWLFVMTKNYCLMELRKQNTQDKHLAAWQNEQQLFMESETFLHPIDDSEAHTQQLKMCIEQLKRDQKACIELFYYENKCYVEIAGLLKIDEKKVKSHLQNGKRNLKICLEQHQYVREV